MIDSQVTQMRCGACRAMFQEDTPVNVSVDKWAAWVGAMRCPACGSSKLLFGQGRSVSDDATFEWGKSLDERVGRWLIDGESGISSKAILERMTGRHQSHRGNPEDVGDLRRCMLLLIRIPEWQPRMGEMAAVSEQWGFFARSWPVLSNLFREEAGPDLTGYPTPRTSVLVAACAGRGEMVVQAMAEAGVPMPAETD